MIIEIVAGFTVVFLIGFILGKRAGRKQGYREGLTSAPLQLRERSLDQGRCALCQSPVMFTNDQLQIKKDYM